jgi:30S ribosomal protein S31
MGRGDKRSKKGKRFKGSFGNTRRHKLKKAPAVVAVQAKPAVEEVAEKAPAKKPRKKKAE